MEILEKIDLKKTEDFEDYEENDEDFLKDFFEDTE
jgi:hypothetical protein